MEDSTKARNTYSEILSSARKLLMKSPIIGGRDDPMPPAIYVPALGADILLKDYLHAMGT